MASGVVRGARSGRTQLSLKGRALALLAQREHSAAELRRKLLRHARAEAVRASASEAGLAAGEAEAESEDAADDDVLGRVEAVIEWLRTHRYFSEDRFVESRVHARASRYGNLRIRQELAQHGLTLPSEAAQALQDSELARATEVWRRKFGAAPADAAERARQSRFLAQRGFSPAVIGKVMRNAGAANSDEGD